MTPDNNPLDREIEAALDGVDLQALGKEEAPPRTSGGDRLYDGVVSGVHGDDVIVELGPRMQGVASLREFDEPPEVGNRFRFLLRGRDDDLWILSMRDAQEIAAWDALEKGSLTKARVTGQNQGGLQLKIGKHEAFMPTSQASIDREADLSKMIGETIVAEVMEIDRSRKRVVLSRRRIEERERMEKFTETVGQLQPGLKLRGKVTRIEAFGAFVDVGGVEGLMHVSNISRKRVEDVNEVLKVGQEVEVMVLEIKEGGKRIGLGMKQLEPDPWDDIDYRLHADAQVTGKVTRVMDFGAFVELFEGVEGLIHVSQLSRDRVRNVNDVIKVDQEVVVRVTSVDAAARRISLSRLDERGAVLGSDEAVESHVIEDALRSSTGSIGTNLGSLFKKALGGDEKRG